MSTTTKYVTAGRWNVAYGTGRHIDGVELHVGYYEPDEPNRFGGRGQYHRHDCYGMTFATREDAQQYAIAQGFLKPYVYRSLDDLVAEWQEREPQR